LFRYYVIQKAFSPGAVQTRQAGVVSITFEGYAYRPWDAVGDFRHRRHHSSLFRFSSYELRRRFRLLEPGFEGEEDA
jgi:hypothetical protein